MSLNLKAYCYGFASGCRKFYIFPVGCCKPKMVGKHYSTPKLNLLTIYYITRCTYIQLVQNYSGSYDRMWSISKEKALLCHRSRHP